MSNNIPCPCGSELNLEQCCSPYIYDGVGAPTAEKLMRSRFTAYTLHEATYLFNTTHISERRYTHKSDILAWAKQNTWQKLEVIKSTENAVEFKAYFLDENQKPQIHHEKSTFINFENVWYYVDGKFY